MIRAIIRFQVQTGAEQAFEVAFKEAGMFERPGQLEGFVSMELVKSIEDPGEYVVISSWEQRKDYEAWQKISTAEAPREALRRLADTLVNPKPGKGYFVVGSG